MIATTSPDLGEKESRQLRTVVWIGETAVVAFHGLAGRIVRPRSAFIHRRISLIRTEFVGGGKSHLRVRAKFGRSDWGSVLAYGQLFPNPVREGLPTNREVTCLGECVAKYRQRRLHFEARTMLRCVPSPYLLCVRMRP